MSNNGEPNDSRARGRDLGEILSLGTSLQTRLSNFAMTPDHENPLPPPANPLSIPRPFFSTPLTPKFHFPGYERQNASVYQLGPILPQFQRPRLSIPRMDQVYIAETSDLLKHFRPPLRINPFERFSLAMIGKEKESMFAKVWDHLERMTEAPPNVEFDIPFVQLLRNARRIVERNFLEYLSTMVTQEFLDRPIGVEMHDAHLCLSFVRIQIRENSQLPNENGDVGWRVLYYAMRCGNYKAMDELVKSVRFPPGASQHSPEYVFHQWKSTCGRMPLSLLADMTDMCQRLLPRANQFSIDEYFMMRTIAFFCGCIGIVDALMAETGTEWESLDDFLWFGLGCVREIPGIDCDEMFNLRALQKRINTYSEEFYTDGGRDPMRYIEILFSSLLFKKALKFMLSLSDRSVWYVIAVHVAIGLEFLEMLDLGGEEDEACFSRKQIGQIVEKYADVFSDIDSPIYYQYLFFAQKLAEDQIQNMEDAMIDSIMEQVLKDETQGVKLSQKTLETLNRYVSKEWEKDALLIDTAKRLEEKGHWDFAYKCYLAGSSRTQAMESLNKLIVKKLSEMITEKISGEGERFESDRRHVAVLLNQSNSIYSESEQDRPHNRAIQNAESEKQKAKQIFEILEAFHQNNLFGALHLFENLSFLPKTENEIDACRRQLLDMYPTLLEILQKLFSLLSKIMIEQANQGIADPNDEHSARISVYQNYIQSFPNDYSFKGIIQEELATASRVLNGV